MQCRKKHGFVIRPAVERDLLINNRVFLFIHFFEFETSKISDEIGLKNLEVPGIEDQKFDVFRRKKNANFQRIWRSNAVFHYAN
ncbi:hypothetical protein HNY73_012013 [Argiope bruennichi]|uniref:Uncharacterized protein n=1 Tax=Argiope bruennichi TaxID=94029 RepID=A0A8T0ETK5_ARGBR|nr:hypothetical protein HNY73_012013 [Argiope bruennichi]